VNQQPDRPAPNTGYGWLIVAMMFLFMMINFADKAVLGLAAGPIIKELHLTYTQFGQVGSAFFLLFSASAALVGFVANRWPTKYVLAVMGLIWALTQLPMLGAMSLSVLVASRIVLGAGEGPAYPVALHAVYKWFTNERRTLPTSLVAVGAAVGAGITAPLLTWIILTFGWRAAFVCLGVAGFVWVGVWMFVGREGPLETAEFEPSGAPAGSLPYTLLLTSRTAIGVTLSAFAEYWVVVLAIVWLPSFLTKAAGYTPTETGWIVLLPTALLVLLLPATGYLSQVLRTRGASSRTARGVLAGGSVTVAGIALMLLSQSTAPSVQIPLVVVAFSVGGVTNILGPPALGEISPVHQRGAVLGISNAVFTLAGFVAPWVMGKIVDIGVDPAAGFRNGFLFGGALVAAGGLIAAALIHPERDLVRFARRTHRTEVATIAVSGGEKAW